MQASLKSSPVFTAAVILSFFCHFIILSIFQFSVQYKFQHENPYLISLGAILGRDEPISTHKNQAWTDLKLAPSEIVKPSLLIQLSGKTKPVKPSFAPQSDIQKKD